MTTYKQLNEIIKNINSNDYDYDYVGLRVQTEANIKIGEILYHKSNVWDNGEMTSTKLDGVSTIDINATLPNIDYAGYFGKTILMLGSDKATMGEDAGEIIMYNPVVLDIIEGELTWIKK